MIFGRKKVSAIDRRLQELQRKMATVSTEIKSLARYEKAAGDVSGPAVGSARFAAAGSETANKSGPAAESFAAGGESRISGADDLLAGGRENEKSSMPLAADAAGGHASDLPLFENRSPLSTTGRQKFANYFMAGHFSNLRPLRQEKRIIRNKAIVMIVLVGLALIWLLFFLYNQ